MGAILKLVLGFAGGPPAWFAMCLSGVKDAFAWCLKHWKLVLSVLALVWAFGYGYHWRGDKDANEIKSLKAEIAAMKEQAATDRATRQKMISALAVDLGKTKQDLYGERTLNASKRQEQEQDYAKHLHDFVPSGTSCLRTGFVRYIDSAAAGVPLAPGSEPGLASAPSGVADDAAAAVIQHNYSLYHACEDRVTGLLKEFDALRGKFNAKVEEINAHVRDPP